MITIKVVIHFSPPSTLEPCVADMSSACFFHVLGRALVPLCVKDTSFNVP